MKKSRVQKGIIIWIILALLTATIVITVPTNVSAAGPWYVNGITGNDNWDGTSPVHPPNPPGNLIGPWKTIGKATNSVNAGETVYVAAATYTENVVIDKNAGGNPLTGLKLIGADRATTKIQAPGAGGHVVEIKVNDVIIEGFTIQYSGTAVGDSGIKLTGNAGNKITGCEISDITLNKNNYGIYLFHAEDNTIGTDTEYINCYDNIYGIVLGNSGRVVGSTIHKNIIKKITISYDPTSSTSEDNGIWLANSDYNEFTNIEISQDWDSWDDGAIKLTNRNSSF